MDHNWMVGLDEQTSSDILEMAWQESWREWRVLHTRDPWQKDCGRLDWVKKRLNWIQALRLRLRSEHILAMARGGLVTSEFILGSTEDPFGEL